MDKCGGVYIEDVRQQMCGKMSGLRGRGGVRGEIYMKGVEYHRMGVEADLRERQILSPSFSFRNAHQIIFDVPQRIYCTVFGVSSPTVVTRIPH